MGNSPNVQFFMKNNFGYEQVLVDNSHDEKGNIVVIVPSAINKFKGKILIS